MILDAICSGDFHPEETGFMDHPNYCDTVREIDFCRAALMESLDKEDCTLLEKLLEQSKYAESIASFLSFQYGFAAGLVLLQEAQAKVREQSATEMLTK